MAATYSSAPSTQAQNKAKADIKFTAELDEILKRITEIKNIAGVIVVNSEGITVKSTLENSLSVQVLLFSSTYFLKGCCTTASKYRPWKLKVYANIFCIPPHKANIVLHYPPDFFFAVFSTDIATVWASEVYCPGPGSSQWIDLSQNQEPKTWDFSGTRRWFHFDCGTKPTGTLERRIERSFLDNADRHSYYVLYLRAWPIDSRNLLGNHRALAPVCLKKRK